MVFQSKNQTEPPLDVNKNGLKRKDYPIAYLEWQRIVTNKMSHLSKPQAVVLAMWSFGIAVTHCCGLSTVTVFRSGTSRSKAKQHQRKITSMVQRKTPGSR